MKDLWVLLQFGTINTLKNKVDEHGCCHGYDGVSTLLQRPVIQIKGHLCDFHTQHVSGERGVWVPDYAWIRCLQQLKSNTYPAPWKFACSFILKSYLLLKFFGALLRLVLGWCAAYLNCCQLQHLEQFVCLVSLTWLAFWYFTIHCWPRRSQDYYPSQVPSNYCNFIPGASCIYGIGLR